MTSSNQPVPQPSRFAVGAAKEHPPRERFDAHELAVILSHYDLGIIEHIRAYPRGSRRSPKVWIKSAKGEYLLKRRAPGHEDPYRVAFAHDLQLELARRNFPVPGLIGSRLENNSMVLHEGHSYELFRYVHGTRYDKSHDAAVEVGVKLGRFHRTLEEYRSVYEPPVGSFHASSEVDAKIGMIPAAVHAVEPKADPKELESSTDFLSTAYKQAAGRVNELGFSQWPRDILHGDWHPGNLLYRNGTIVAVLDFDSSRLEPRVVDVANASLQFSMKLAAPDKPETWPDGLDRELIQYILKGYDQQSGRPLRKEERLAMPWLIIEALIVESIVPIAATGSFSRIPGSPFIQMVQRKVKWIAERATQLAELR